MAYIFAVHVPIAGMAFLPILFKMPIVLFPAHIAFLELIIDPACSTVFESEVEERDIMDRPPRNLKDSLFNRRALFISLGQGLIVLLTVFAVFVLTLYWGKSEMEARTLAFVSIVIANLMLIITNLSWHKNFIQILKEKNQALYLVLGGTTFSLGLIFNVPFLRNIFHFSYLSFSDLLMALAAGVISVMWFEGLKLINKNSR